MPFLSLFDEYHYIPRKLTRPIWTDVTNNICVIKHSTYDLSLPKEKIEDAKVRKYYLINLVKTIASRAYVTTIYDRHVYEYFTMDTRGYLAGVDYNGLNNLYGHMLELGARHRKILVNWNLCFDNIPGIYWKTLHGRTTDIETRKALAGKLDPHNLLDRMSVNEKIEQGLRFVELRHELNEAKEAINIFDMMGIIEYTQKLYIADLECQVEIGGQTVPLGSKFSFSKTEVAEQLEYIKERLGTKGGKGKQRFYITQPSNIKNTFILFQNAEIATYSRHSQHGLNAVVFWPDKDVTSSIFSYIETVIVGGRDADDQQPFGSSVLMSDEDAEKFLTRLIKELNDNKGESE